MPIVRWMRAFENIDTATQLDLVQWSGDEDIYASLHGQLSGVPLTTPTTDFGTGAAVFPGFTWESDGASFTVPEIQIPVGGIPIAIATYGGDEGFNLQIVTLEWLRLNGVIVAIIP